MASVSPLCLRWWLRTFCYRASIYGVVGVDGVVVFGIDNDYVAVVFLRLLTLCVLPVSMSYMLVVSLVYSGVVVSVVEYTSL